MAGECMKMALDLELRHLDLSSHPRNAAPINTPQYSSGCHSKPQLITSSIHHGDLQDGGCRALPSAECEPVLRLQGAERVRQR